MKILILLLLFKVTLLSESLDLNEIEKEAQKGQSSSQYQLGKHYCQKRDYKKAVFWLEKAAIQKEKLAFFELGVIYSSDVYIKRDSTKAIFWLKQSANQGHSASMYWIALNLEDEKKQLEWFQRAAKLQHSISLGTLAHWYTIGRVVKKDLKKAKSLYKAALKNPPNKLYKDLFTERLNKLKLN